MPSVTKRPDSTVAMFRVKVPADIRERARGQLVFVDLPAMREHEAVTVTAKMGEHVKFSLGTRDPAVAKARNAAAVAHLAKVFEAVRTGPEPISFANLVSLSRDVYAFYVETFRDEPGEPDSWAAMKAINRAITEGRLKVAPALHPDPACANEIAIARELFGFDLTAGVDGLAPSDEPNTAGLEARFGLLSTWLLARRAIVLTSADRGRLLIQVSAAATDAFRALKRMSTGDYTADPKAERFPAFAERHTVSLWALYDAWAAERDPVASTRGGYRVAIAEFVSFAGHDDAARITPKSVVAWKDAMLTAGVLSERTVADVKLAALKSILALAARNHRIPSNPAAGITVSRKPKAGDKMKGHRETDARVILEAALAQTRPALKWVPWLMALTGARIGEVCQLRAADIRREDGEWVIDFSSKTLAGMRSVPIHAGLIERGFLDFVRTRGAGYLFFEQRRLRKDAVAKPGKSVANDVREWIASFGLDVGLRHRIAPAHGFRHLFTTTARKVGMDSEKREAMLGHELGGERGTYGAMAGLAAEIAKLPDPLRA